MSPIINIFIWIFSVKLLYRYLYMQREMAETICHFSLSRHHRSWFQEVSVGIGTNGCSVMVGRKNSVYTHPVKKNKNCLSACHSVQLCAIQHRACKAVGTQSQVFNFTLTQVVFSQCTENMSIYQFINPGETPLMLMQLYTYCHFMQDCCVHVLEQWDELKLHFHL